MTRVAVVAASTALPCSYCAMARLLRVGTLRGASFRVSRKAISAFRKSLFSRHASPSKKSSLARSWSVIFWQGSELRLMANDRVLRTVKEASTIADRTLLKRNRVSGRGQLASLKLARRRGGRSARFQECKIAALVGAEDFLDIEARITACRRLY